MLDSDVNEPIIINYNGTLDCGDYSINGSGAGSGIGVYLHGWDTGSGSGPRFRINNCEVKNWDIGLAATLEQYMVILDAKKVIFLNNALYDIVCVESEVNIFDSNFLCEGDVCPDISVISNSCSNNTIENNRFIGANIAIEEKDSVGSSIIKNTFSSKVAGVVAVDVVDLELSKNAFNALPSDDLFAAIYVLGLDDSANNIVIKKNHISNYPGGIALQKIKYVWVEDNFTLNANVPFYSAGNQEKVTLKDNTFLNSGAIQFGTWDAGQYARDIFVTGNKFNGQGYESYVSLRNYGIVFDYQEGTDLDNINFYLNTFKNVINGAAFLGKNSGINIYGNNFLSVEDNIFLSEVPLIGHFESIEMGKIGNYYGNGINSCDAPSQPDFFDPFHAPVIDDYPAASIFPDGFESGDKPGWNSCNP